MLIPKRVFLIPIRGPEKGEGEFIFFFLLLLFPPLLFCFFF